MKVSGAIERAIASEVAGPLLLIAGGAVLVLYVLPKVLKGIFTNKNPVTNNQTDAYGNPVTAYSETTTPIIGTLGAAANSVSGGTLASIGEWLGGKIADITMPYDPNAPATTRQQVVTPNNVSDVSELGAW
jgi:hypothetical protein